LREARQNRSLAQEEGNSEDVQEWEESEIELIEQIERMRTGWDRANSPVVSAEDIAEVVSMWTGVPLMQLAEEESQRLLQDGGRTARASSARMKPSTRSPVPCAAPAPG
jgi:ATP-dependent Clp protease ATP-binding subunit ClpC